MLEPSNKRSQSLPPNKSQKMLTTVELERHTYVSQLKDRVTETFSWPTCRSGGTIGSYGHPELCGKPCIRFYFGSCTKGVNCQFCHLVHDQRKKKLDKEQRQRLERLSEAQVLSLLLYQIETCCREKQMTDRLIFVLVSLRRRLRQHRGDLNLATDAQVQEMHSFFANIFKKLSIARLIDLMKNHPAVSQDLKDEVFELLSHATLQGSPSGDSS